MKINVIYDASVSSAPAGFQTGVATAVDFLEKEFANPVTITIHVGYGDVDGQALGANALGESFYAVGEPENYSSVRNALIAEGAPGASTLPSTSPFSGTLYLTPADPFTRGLIDKYASTFGRSVGIHGYDLDFLFHCLPAYRLRRSTVNRTRPV